jgi:hypothetical protein
MHKGTANLAPDLAADLAPDLAVGLAPDLAVDPSEAAADYTPICGPVPHAPRATAAPHHTLCIAQLHLSEPAG